jgi:hypothetical protein
MGTTMLYCREKNQSMSRFNQRFRWKRTVEAW